MLICLVFKRQLKNSTNYVETEQGVFYEYRKMSKSPQTIFGIRLRAARLHAGLAQDRLGVLIGLDEGCSSARISRYETGTYEPPFEMSLKLAEVLNVPVAYFYCPEIELADLLLETHSFSSELLLILLSIARAMKEQALIK